MSTKSFVCVRALVSVMRNVSLCVYVCLYIHIYICTYTYVCVCVCAVLEVGKMRVKGVQSAGCFPCKTLSLSRFDTSTVYQHVLLIQMALMLNCSARFRHHALIVIRTFAETRRLTLFVAVVGSAAIVCEKQRADANVRKRLRARRTLLLFSIALG